jgi:hypothetical protein
LYCNSCNKELAYDSDQGIKTIKKHLESKSHAKAASLKSHQKRLNVKKIDDQFEFDLMEAFASANIPIYKIQDLRLKKFLEKYTGRAILDESHYRKEVLPRIFDKSRAEIIKKLKFGPIYLIFDENTDSLGRYMLNILIGNCNKNESSTPLLFKTVDLERTNSITVSSAIISILNELYLNNEPSLATLNCF